LISFWRQISSNMSFYC